jgi:hypothetical protein
VICRCHHSDSTVARSTDLAPPRFSASKVGSQRRWTTTDEARDADRLTLGQEEDGPKHCVQPVHSSVGKTATKSG